MRESKAFAKRSRTKKSNEAVKKYFLVFEGAETEFIYFNAMIDLKKEIRINPIIELRPLIRSYNEEGWSNPKKILERIIHNLEESQTGKITYETFLNRIMDYLYGEKVFEKNRSQAKTVWSILTLFCKKELNKELSDIVEDMDDVCEKISAHLEKETSIPNIVADISEIIKNQDITYDAEFDKICLIVDRDKQSFVSHPDNNQYEYVLNTCRKKGFGFYLTNPCFEFWLLLHFDGVFSLDINKLLNNPRITSRKRYAESKLKKFLPNYRKSMYDAYALMKLVDKAIKNEKRFCENIEKLEFRVGSNIGLLIEEMRM